MAERRNDQARRRSSDADLLPSPYTKPRAARLHDGCLRARTWRRSCSSPGMLARPRLPLHELLEGPGRACGGEREGSEALTNAGLNVTEKSSTAFVDARENLLTAQTPNRLRS